MADLNQCQRLWSSLEGQLKQDVAETYCKYCYLNSRPNGSYPSWEEAMEYALIVHGLLKAPSIDLMSIGAGEYEEAIKAEAAMAETSEDWNMQQDGHVSGLACQASFL